MNKNNIKSLSLWLAIGVIGLLATSGVVYALSGNFPIGIETCNNCGFNVPASESSGEEVLGSGTRFPHGLSADSTAPSTGQVRGATLLSTGAGIIGTTLGVGGATTLDGTLSYLELTEAVTATDTIAIAESGKTFYISGTTTTLTLPAISTADGVIFRFVVSGDLSTDVIITTAGAADIIEGTLIVAGAAVDCEAEDKITFVGDGENLGDYSELRSNGTNWFIGSSGALSGSKMTCSTT